VEKHLEWEAAGGIAERLMTVLLDSSLLEQ